MAENLASLEPANCGWIHDLFLVRLEHDRSMGDDADSALKKHDFILVVVLDLRPVQVLDEHFLVESAEEGPVLELVVYQQPVLLRVKQAVLIHVAIELVVFVHRVALELVHREVG